MDTVVAKVEEILKKSLKIEKVDSSVKLREQGLDSLDLVEIMMELETTFNIEFTNDEMLGFETVGEVVKNIQEKVAKK
jgi:acyl carrier protein